MGLRIFPPVHVHAGKEMICASEISNHTPMTIKRFPTPEFDA
jgi:hypothetical protein